MAAERPSSWLQDPCTTAAFSASQIPSEREDAQYDLRGARSYPTLEDEGEQAAGRRGA